MRRLEKPVEDYSDVYDACISNFNSINLTHRFRNAKVAVIAASVRFDHLMLQNRLYTFAASNLISSGITKVEMNKLYTQKLSKSGHIARNHYDAIKSATQRCPLCAVRVVTTLDHYLPKGEYPIFAIYPLNLIPACRDCNTDKLSNVATMHSEETLHPYYDDIDGDEWLIATVEHSSPISFSFFVAPPPNWSNDLAGRVHTHLNVFKLYSLYSSHAAEELSNIRGTLENLSNNGAPGDVAAHLMDGFISRLKNQRNSWQTAMYRAMAQDIWFHNQF
jgi:hypothetical protein